MAKNFVIPPTKTRSWACTHPATPASGDPVIKGARAGVALTAEGGGGNATGMTSVGLDGIARLSVKGVDAEGNSAVVDGDALYYVSADTPPVSKKATGVYIGTAEGAVVSGATTTIPVEIGR